jgi:8-oxo-dGTP pyrophosphatase MutT (NUDIX family)
MVFMPRFEDSYLGQLVQIRDFTQKDYKFLLPAARAVVRDPSGKILFVRRKDNGKWVMPSGSQELGESIYDCLRRETKEEAGIQVISATVMAIYNYLPTGADFYQTLHIQFLVNEWSGQVIKETDETIDARFLSIEEIRSMPPDELSSYYLEVIEDLESFDGQVIHKGITA